MKAQRTNKLVYVHFNKHISSIDSKLEKRSIHMLNKYLRTKGQQQLLISKFQDEYNLDRTTFGLNLSERLEQQWNKVNVEVDEELPSAGRNEQGESSHQTSEQVGRETKAAPIKRRKEMKIDEDELNDDDFLSDEEAILTSMSLVSKQGKPYPKSTLMI
ncbi:hypothetical protein R1flu_025469 [Riccia fluitans]|uniref:Uncharacterized protein n=1 Tax=Riccia fluitans TaxID=41844 RepID=A0ABD1XXU8_9MARC